MPAVAADGVLTAKFAPVEVMARGLTVIKPEVPAIAACAVSVAVTVRVPDFFSVAAKVAVPLARVVFAGRTAMLSEEVKDTVPV